MKCTVYTSPLKDHQSFITVYGLYAWYVPYLLFMILFPLWVYNSLRYNDVITGAMASQITSVTVVYSIVYSDADQRKHQSSALLAFARGIHRGPVNSPHKRPVTRKMFPFDDVIMVGNDETKSNNPYTKFRTPFKLFVTFIALHIWQGILPNM